MPGICEPQGCRHIIAVCRRLSVTVTPSHRHTASPPLLPPCPHNQNCFCSVTVRRLSVPSAFGRRASIVRRLEGRRGHRATIMWPHEPHEYQMNICRQGSNCGIVRLLSIKMNWCRQRSNLRIVGDKNGRLPPRIGLWVVAVKMNFAAEEIRLVGFLAVGSQI